MWQEISFKSLIVYLCCLFLTNCKGQMQGNFKTISITAPDGIPITGDLYLSGQKDAPLILLFHQAGFSRGEYRSIAPHLNALGFNCLAIDQRSGDGINGVENETHKAAKEQNKGTNYEDAIQDLEAAFSYVKNELKAKHIILWGSSYSAALVFYLGSKYKSEIDGILAFSPGEYLKINGKEIQSYAADVICPVFITSAKNEQDRWDSIYQSIKTEKSFFVPNVKGYHGSKALWPEHEGSDEYWSAVKKFLAKIKH